MFKFPVQGERCNASAIPIPDADLAALLSGAARSYAQNPCPVDGSDGECENCNAHRRVWWDACNALERSVCLRLQRWLRENGIPLPDAPWEDLNADGTVKGS